jgi:drug/metabolite transporter (DMT)-like permease
MIATEHRTQKPEPGTAGVITAMGFAVIALAFSSIFITKLEQSEVPPLVIGFYRMAIATVLLLPVSLALKRREIAALARRDLLLLALGGLCLAVHFGAWITSMKYIPIATAVVLGNSHPIFVVLASYFFLGEKPRTRSLMGTLTGLLGMVIISYDALRGNQAATNNAIIGDGLAVLAALAIVGYFIVGRKARARISLLSYVTPLYGICSVILLIWILGLRDQTRPNPLYPYSASVWAYFVALAIVPTILGHTVFNWALKHVRPSAISLLFLGEPVVASVLAFFIFSQRPPLATFTGGALVLAGVYLTTSARQPDHSSSSDVAANFD